jgi:hypothetical protein
LVGAVVQGSVMCGVALVIPELKLKQSLSRKRGLGVRWEAIHSKGPDRGQRCSYCYSTGVDEKGESWGGKRLEVRERDMKFGNR